MKILTIRRGLILGAVLIFAANAGSPGKSFGILSDQAERENVMHAALTDISVEEEYEPPKELIPGQVIRKVPRVHNGSAHPVRVRVWAGFSDLEAELLFMPLQIQSGWEKAEDGFYYWQDELAAGERTSPLFESLTVREDASREALNALPSFEVLIYAEGIPAAGEGFESFLGG